MLKTLSSLVAKISGMNTSFFRITLLAVAGAYIVLMGYMLPYAATPLLSVSGTALMLYAMYLFMRGNDLSGTGQAPTFPAEACLHANHAGCQDDPECVCGCHRERIEVMIPTF